MTGLDVASNSRTRRCCYRPGTGFYNPSVYCPDLMNLIGHIRETMRADIDERRGKQGTA